MRHNILGPGTESKLAAGIMRRGGENDILLLHFEDALPQLFVIGRDGRMEKFEGSIVQFQEGRVQWSTSVFCPSSIANRHGVSEENKMARMCRKMQVPPRPESRGFKYPITRSFVRLRLHPNQQKRQPHLTVTDLPRRRPTTCCDMRNEVRTILKDVPSHRSYALPGAVSGVEITNERCWTVGGSNKSALLI